MTTSENRTGILTLLEGISNRMEAEKLAIRFYHKAPLEKFIKSSKVSDCIVFEDTLSVFVRQNSNRFLDGDLSTCFDIVTVTNHDTSSRGSGKFWRLLDDIKELLVETDTKYLYLENVFNDQLLVSLLRRGFTSTGSVNENSMYLKLKTSQL